MPAKEYYWLDNGVITTVEKTAQQLTTSHKNWSNDERCLWINSCGPGRSPVLDFSGKWMIWYTCRKMYVFYSECKLAAARTLKFSLRAFGQRFAQIWKSNGADARCEISRCDGCEPKSSQQQMKSTEQQGEGQVSALHYWALSTRAAFSPQWQGSDSR